MPLRVYTGDLPLAEAIGRYHIVINKIIHKDHANQQESMTEIQNPVLKIVHYSEAAIEIQAIRQEEFEEAGILHIEMQRSQISNELIDTNKSKECSSER